MTTDHRLVPSTGGSVLEVLVERPPIGVESRGSVLICHPHPEQGGTMRAPIIGAVAAAVVRAGFTAVRFNFRGVGESTGTHDRGVGEVSDVATVAGFIIDSGELLIGVVGWSFGAAVSLRWQAQTHSEVPYVGIAPPVYSPLTPALPEPDDLAPARRHFIVGERDQFVEVAALEGYALSIGASIDVFPGSDHFFVFRHEKLADAVVDFLDYDE